MIAERRMKTMTLRAMPAEILGEVVLLFEGLLGKEDVGKSVKDSGCAPAED